MDEETKKLLEEAVAKAVAENNAKRDEAEAGLKAKLDEVLAERKADRDKAREAAEAAEKAKEEAARKSGDTEALEASWAAKYEKLQQEMQEASRSKDAAIESLTVGQQATALAAELAVTGSAVALERFIAPRLGYEMKDGQARVYVKDQTGKPSALTVEELKAEIAADKALAPLIAASKASGGGAADANGGAGKSKTVTRDAWNSMSHPDRAAFSKDGGKVIDAE